VDTSANPLSADEHCSTIEVARMLGMAVRSIQMMVDRGELVAWKTPGGHRRIQRESVVKWMNGRRADASARASVPAPAHDRPALKVMLVEDSAHTQSMVTHLVKQHFPHVELHVADDGFAGLALAGQLQPKVLIVNLTLPGIDGGSMITSLRTHPQFKGVRLHVIANMVAAQRKPFDYALQGVSVIDRYSLATELPAQLAISLAAP
jgi:excisionase family DNA binding protein